MASGDCGSGAAGGVTGEIVGVIYLQNRLKSGQFTFDDLDRLQKNTGQVGRLSGALVAALAGRDVNAGALAGGNAAENNAAGKLAVTAVKLSARLLKKALKNGKLTARDIKEAGLDELVGFADDLATLANPDSTLVDRALAVLSLTVGLGKDEIDAISGGIKHIAGKGKKHAPNRAVKVDVADAKKGTPGYEALNNPKPNTTTELSNGTTFKTNSGGYVEEISFKPSLSKGTRDSRQTAVGKEGLNGDVGGHIQACRLGGTCDRFNLFPQNSNFNSSSYRRWENEITSALQNGNDVGNVTVRFGRSNPNSARPDSVDIEYSINGVPETRSFLNQAGGGQ